MKTCDVCCEKINKTQHKIVECFSCNYEACRACIQKYILSIYDDPHCMNCKIPWKREFIDSFCTKNFRRVEYKNHRENVLLEREKLLIPETQPEVERIKKARNLVRIIRRQREHILELQNMGQHTDMERLYLEIENTYAQLENVRNTPIVNQRRFIRKCPNEDCKGFLDMEWYCGICEIKYCKDCNEIQTPTHTCDPQTVETIKLLNEDSKSCPTCGIVIQKSSGCAQMWCTQCHTAFNWNTGEIDHGRVHNPHYIEFKKRKIQSREHGDIPCGGIPSFKELREMYSPNDILQFANIIYDLERELLFLNMHPNNNTDARIGYILGDIEEDDFKMYIQRREKLMDKLHDVSDIFETLLHTGGDLLRQYVIEPWRHDTIVEIMKRLIDYGNERFENIRQRYVCNLPKNINVELE